MACRSAHFTIDLGARPARKFCAGEIWQLRDRYQEIDLWLRERPIIGYCGIPANGGSSLVVPAAAGGVLMVTIGLVATSSAPPTPHHSATRPLFRISLLVLPFAIAC
jgi:hypothetical protein